MESTSQKDAVLITGASRGIGKAIAEIFAKEGHPLYLCCNNSITDLEELCAYLTDKYETVCTPYKCNVGDESSVVEMFRSMNESVNGAPLIVINNAGIAHYGLLSDMTSEEWHEITSVNIDSLFYVCKNAIPPMLQCRRGRIINISSVWGNVGASCEVAYSTTKGAVNSFTKALAKELAPSGIPVNALACGMVNTEMNTKHLSMEEIAEIAAEIPADRICEPEEIAEAVLTLVKSPTYLTGQIITIDGGWT